VHHFAKITELHTYNIHVVFVVGVACVGISGFGDMCGAVPGNSLVSSAVGVPAWFLPKSEMPQIKSVLEKLLELSKEVGSPVNSGHADSGMDPDTPHTTGKVAGKVSRSVSSSGASVYLSVCRLGIGT